MNTHERAFHIRLGRKTFRFPFVKADPTPTANDPIIRVYADPELAHQGFSFVLASGKEGSVLADQVLEYNRDPRLLRLRPSSIVSSTRRIIKKPSIRCWRC